MRTAGLLGQIAPRGWAVPWNGPSRAMPHAHAALHSLAPKVCTVAISTNRLVSLSDRTGTLPYRTASSVHPRTLRLDALALLRRFLQPVLPAGCRIVRHCGVRHARCALPPATLRQLILQAHPSDLQPMQSSPPPFAACGPTCGAPRRVVMRLGTAHTACVEAG
jgi:hypothetical protein